jgi:hypothetical protein
LLEFIRAITGKDRVRVCIDKAREQDALAGVDDFAIGVDQRFDLATPSNGFDPIAAHKHRTVFDNCELAQIATRTSVFRARERDDL